MGVYGKINHDVSQANTAELNRAPIHHPEFPFAHFQTSHVDRCTTREYNRVIKAGPLLNKGQANVFLHHSSQTNTSVGQQSLV